MIRLQLQYLVSAFNYNERSGLIMNNFMIIFFQVAAPIFASLVSAFDYIEADNRKILNYGWVNFPLAYVQVATLSVYTYVTFSLFAAQYLEVISFLKSIIFDDIF